MERDIKTDGYPVKLVRDDVGVMLGELGSVTYERVRDRDVLVRLLRSKLIEEAVEYVTNPSVEELADVWEVVKALALHDLGQDSLLQTMEAAQRKQAERGGFDRGTVMVAHHERDYRPPVIGHKHAR